MYYINGDKTELIKVLWDREYSLDLSEEDPVWDSYLATTCPTKKGYVPITAEEAFFLDDFHPEEDFDWPEK